MTYSITLRSRIDATITGWYDGSRSRWSTDHRRRRLFDNKHEAKSIREELRSLCPRNAKVINIEPEQVDDNGGRIWRGFAGSETRHTGSHARERWGTRDPRGLPRP